MTLTWKCAQKDGPKCFPGFQNLRLGSIKLLQKSSCKVYAPQTKILEDWTKERSCIFEALFKGVSTLFGLRIVEKCFENTLRVVCSTVQNLRLGSINFARWLKKIVATYDAFFWDATIFTNNFARLTLIRQFDTSDLATRLPVGIKRQLVHALCIEYTKTMTTRIRRVVVQSAVVALERHHLPEYAQVARSVLS